MKFSLCALFVFQYACKFLAYPMEKFNKFKIIRPKMIVMQERDDICDEMMSAILKNATAVSCIHIKKLLNMPNLIQLTSNRLILKTEKNYRKTNE